MIDFAKKLLARKAAKVLLAALLAGAGVTLSPGVLDALIEVASVLLESAG